MTADGFRRAALSFPEAEERSHMKHPDFRVRGKIFATLGYPDKTRGMVKLTPDQQGLKCPSCRRVYPIRDDIPVMLVDEARIEEE